MTTREKLIDVAGRLFAARGYDAVSVRDIAKASRTNLGAVTYHFGSKEALFSEIVGIKLGSLRSEMANIVEGDAGPEDKLRRMVERFAFRVLHDDPGLRVLFIELLSGGRRLPAQAVEAIKWRNRVFADIVGEGVRKGIFRECDMECTAWAFFGMLSNYVFFEPLMRDKIKNGVYSKRFVRRAVDASLDVFMNGLKK